jgi:hypothetical protein
MSGVAKKLMGTTAAGGGPLAIEDVFSTYLYTGNSSTQTITNDIDLAGEGGLVWIKARNAAINHYLYDTERGATKELSSNLTDAEATALDALTSFNSDGFSLGADNGTNKTSNTHASWTFRKAPRFFDVVTYTGNGVAGRQIPHNLGVASGMAIVKRTNPAADWCIAHKDVDDGSGNLINGLFTTAQFTGTDRITSMSDSDITLGTNARVNNSGDTYVAYLFAHDPLGPSEDGSDGLIACGSYTGNGSSNGPEIDLGWEPQWLLVKNASAIESWYMFDVMRGMPVGGDTKDLYPNTNANEDAYEGTKNLVDPTPTGFKVKDSGALMNGSGQTIIYIAIRRGPMRVPESGTEVFQSVARTGTSAAATITSGFPVDFVYSKARNQAYAGGFLTRLQGAGKFLFPSETNSETTGSNTLTGYDNNTGIFVGSDSQGLINNGTSTTYSTHMFRRSPNFFDVVAYTGDGTAGRTVPHNLGVAPEMMIVKRRNLARNWATYVAPLGNTGSMYLNENQAPVFGNLFWNDVTPIDTAFYLGTNSHVNGSADTYIAYLFASLPGISKVGSYTGNGSSQTIDCGFTTGARFILIKRTDSTGDWYVWDTARGIVTGNDPHLSLNTTAAEVTTDDSIDPDSSGFIVNQVGATNINVSSASYIFMAIS